MPMDLEMPQSNEETVTMGNPIVAIGTSLPAALVEQLNNSSIFA